MTANYYIIPGIITNRPRTFDDVLRVVSCYLGISPQELKEKSRKRNLVFARHLIFYFAKNKTQLTLVSIGEPFGFDHTTVLHGIQKINDYLDVKDEETCKAVVVIESNLR